MTAKPEVGSIQQDRETEFARAQETISKSEREHPYLFQRLTRILFETDPVGFIRKWPELFDDPTEYEGEAGTILPRLRDASCLEDVLEILLQEFLFWFGEDDSHRDDPAYIEAARQIWLAWQEYNVHT